MSRTHVARCVKWSRFGRGSMAKVGQDSGKEQKGRTRRGGRSDETRFAWDEGVSGRIQGRELREGITGGRGGERSRTGSATAAIFHGADVRFRPAITTKYKQKWRTRGEDEGRDEQGVREIRSERGKWERRKSSAERQRGAARRKKDDRLDDTTVVPVVHLGFPFSSFFFPLSFFPPFLFPFSLLRPCYTCRILLDHTVSLRFLSALKSFLCSLRRDRIFTILNIRCIDKL